MDNKGRLYSSIPSKKQRLKTRGSFISHYSTWSFFTGSSHFEGTTKVLLNILYKCKSMLILYFSDLLGSIGVFAPSFKLLATNLILPQVQMKILTRRSPCFPPQSCQFPPLPQQGTSQVHNGSARKFLANLPSKEG